MTYDNVPEPPGYAVHRVGQGILIGGGRVLLAGNRWYTGKPLVWTLPGGRAEEGEGIGEALVREMMEETSLTVEAGDLAFVVEAHSGARRQVFLTCAFVVRRLAGDLACRAGSGVEDLHMAEFAELTTYLRSPSLGDPLRYFMGHPGEPPRYWFYPEYVYDPQP